MGLQEISDQDCLKFLLEAEKVVADLLDELEPFARMMAEAEGNAVHNGLATIESGAH
jgi:hypothetical protein